MTFGRFLRTAIAALTLVFSGGLAWAQSSSPEDLIMSVSQGVLDEIKSDRSLQSGDIERLNRLVDKRVMPHVDFARMTALAVGRNWRSASPEQQKIIMDEFRRLLLLTYSDAVRQVTDTTISLRPSRNKPEDTQVIVRTAVVRPGKEPIQLDYRLEKTGSTWKIFDLNVMGLWLVENYRNQFAQIVTSGGIDGLIRSMKEKNQHLAATTSARRAGN